MWLQVDALVWLSELAVRGHGGRCASAQPEALIAPRGTVGVAGLVVDALATCRLTRLATADVISEPARMAVVRRTDA